MENPTALYLLPRRASPLATAWWIADALGAAAFAAGLANAIGLAAGSDIWFGMGLSVMLLVAGGLLRAMSQAAAVYWGEKAAVDLRKAVRATMFPLLLPSATLRGRLVGEDLRLAIEHPEQIGGYAARYLPIRASANFIPVIVALIVSAASWVAALIMLATMLPFALGMARAGFAARKESEEQLAALGRMSGLFVDRVRNLPTILLFSAEERITRHLAGATEEVAERTIKVLRLAFASSAIMEFFAALSVALVAVYCGFSLLGLLPFHPPEKLTLTSAFFALAMAPEFYLSMRRLAAAYHDKQQGEAAAQAMSDEAARCPTKAVSIPILAPIESLEVQAFSIDYAEGSRLGPFTWNWEGPALHCIEGATGSGKSSLLRSLAGHAPSKCGRMLVNGVQFTPGSINHSIGWAGQAVALLPGSLRDNLSFGHAVDEAELLRLADRLGLAKLIRERGGLDAQVDHRGSGLSGGERRRLGLLRALVSGRPLLLLDEPTADLDIKLAAEISELLLDASRERLIIVATHDESLARKAKSRLKLQ